MKKSRCSTELMSIFVRHHQVHKTNEACNSQYGLSAPNNEGSQWFISLIQALVLRGSGILGNTYGTQQQSFSRVVLGTFVVLPSKKMLSRNVELHISKFTTSFPEHHDVFPLFFLDFGATRTNSWTRLRLDSSCQQICCAISDGPVDRSAAYCRTAATGPMNPLQNCRGDSMGGLAMVSG